MQAIKDPNSARIALILETPEEVVYLARLLGHVPAEVKLELGIETIYTAFAVLADAYPESYADSPQLSIDIV